MYTGYQTNGFLNEFLKATHPTTHQRLRQSTLAVLLIEEGIKPKEEDMQMFLHLLLWICLKLSHVNDELSTTSVSVCICVKTLQHRFWSLKNISTVNKNWSMCVCLLLLSGDIQSNPGPKMTLVYIPAVFVKCRSPWSILTA